VSDEQYIPNARDAVIAYFGRTSYGALRVHCVRCNEVSPLADASKVYGDLYVAEPAPVGQCDDGEECDMCRVRLLALSQACQQEHDEQQARWARVARPTVMIEYGVPAAIRCRVY
jgi:hypothetical protein